MAKKYTDMHIKLSSTLYEQLGKVAVEQKTTKSDVARQLIIAGLKSQGYVRDEDYMYQLVKDALNEVLDKPVERLAAINAKTAQTAGTELFFFTWLAKEILSGSPAAQNQIEEALADARELGIKFLNLPKDKNTEKFMKQGVSNMTNREE